MRFKTLITISLVVTFAISNLSYALLMDQTQIYSSGAIRYITARKLHADGRWLRDPDGKIVQLIGYAGGVQTMSHTPVGLWERDGSTQHYDWSFDEQAVIDNLDAMKRAGANTIRSHIAMWYIKNDGLNVQGQGLVQYKQSFHRMIELAGKRGIYVIIDGMTVTPDFLGGGGQDALPYPPYQDAEPDQALAREVIASPSDFINLWIELALYLKDLPNVIFEPWNEPHAPAGYDSTMVRNEWFGVVRDLVHTFRINGIDQPIVAQWDFGCYVNWDSPESQGGKMNWIDEANGTIDDPMKNLIFSTHLYRHGGAFGVYSLGQARYDYDSVKQAMEYELIYNNSLRYPVLIGEIGARTSQVDNPAYETLALQNALQVFNEWEIGWLVYWWRVAEPLTLFSSNVYQFTPEPNFNQNGLIVRDAMLGTG